MAYIIDIDFFSHGYKVSLHSGGSQSMWFVDLINRKALCSDFANVHEYPIHVWFFFLDKCIWQKETAKLIFTISQASILKNTKYIQEVVYAQLYKEL